MASKDTAGIHQRGEAVIVAALVAAALALGSAVAAATPTTGRAVPAATPTMGSAIAAVTVAAISDEDDCSSGAHLGLVQVRSILGPACRRLRAAWLAGRLLRVMTWVSRCICSPLPSMRASAW